MSVQQQIPLAVNSVKGSVAGHELNENVFVEQTLAGKYPVIYRACEGYVPFCDLGVIEGVKALYTLKDSSRAFAVTQSGVYEIFYNGNALLLGAVVLAGVRVSIADNGLFVAIVDGIKGYYIDLSDSSVNEITAEGFYPARTVWEQDGFLVFDRKGTKQFFITNFNSIDFDPNNFASANGKPDNVVAIKGFQRQLVIACEESIEIWYNAGNPDFPFFRSQGAFIDHGAYPYTLTDHANTVYYVGSDRVVYALVGYTPAPISTPAIATDLADVDLSDAFAMAYTMSDHMFYVLTIPARNKTWVYDITMRNWFVRKSSVFGRHVMNSIIEFDDKNLIADFQAGKIYQLTIHAGSDNGDQLVKKFILPTINIGRGQRRLDSFELDMSVGQGKITGPDMDPQAMLRISKDNGKTYGNKHKTPLGKAGEYNTRVIWRRLGVARQFTNEVTISADIPDLRIGGAWVGLG